MLVNPELAIYKPWLDRAFVEAFGGRKEMSEYLASIGMPYTMATEKAYSTDANVLGATHEAKDLERLDAAMHIVEPIMGVAHWKSDVKVEPEERHRRVRARRARRAQRQALRDRCSRLFVALNAIGGRHGLGMSDQIENRVIDAKSRGIYEAPGHGAPAPRVRAAAERRAQREHDSTCTRRSAAGSGGSSTRAGGTTRRRSC